MARFFDPQRGGWKILGYLADVLILSCLVCSLPVVTLGAATAALYDCAVRCVRQKDPALLSRFFRTFRAELKGSIPTTLLWEALLAGLFLLVRLYGNTAAVNDVSVVLTVAGLCLVGFALGVPAAVPVHLFFCPAERHGPPAGHGPPARHVPAGSGDYGYSVSLSPFRCAGVSDACSPGAFRQLSH